MVDKNELIAKKYYLSRIVQETPYGKSGYVYVDENLNQWLAAKSVDFIGAGPGTMVANNIYWVLLDEEGNLIPAPIDWAGDFPVILGENQG